MDPVTLIVTALAAGAAAGTQDTAAAAVRDAYQRLKQLVADRLSGKKAAEVALAEHQADPETWRAPLEKAVSETGIDADPAVIKAAQALMGLMDAAGSAAGKYTVTLHDAHGVQIGDHNRQVNQFSARGPAYPFPDV